MIDIEQKYYILFFIRWKGFLEWMKRLSTGRVARWIEESGPVVMFGPFIGRDLVKSVKPGLIVLLILAPFMVGGIPASVSTLLFGLMGAAYYLLGLSAYNILLSYLNGGTPMPGIGPVIPGVPIGPYYIPFFSGWLSIILIFLIHEGYHGVVALRRKIPIKDAAMVLLTIVPVAAYVMPDEDKFQKADPSTKTAILSAGPTSNVFAYLPAAILLLILNPILLPYITSVQHSYVLGVAVKSVPDTIDINNAPHPSLVKGKIFPGDMILSIDGKPVKNFSELVSAVREAEGNTLTITVLHGGVEKNITIPNRGYLGIRGFEVKWRESPPLPYRAVTFLLNFLSLFGLLNLMVAVVNALPFSILDGGQSIEEWGKKRGVKIKPLKWLALLLLVINGLPWLIT